MRETHRLSVFGWLATIAVVDECLPQEWARFGSWEAVCAAREIRRTFLRPIQYFGDDAILDIHTHGRA